MGMLNKFNSLVDTAIGVVSPGWERTRRTARVQSNVAKQLGTYVGAESGRIRTNWAASSGSADSDLLPHQKTLRNRSRDLARNNPHAAGILNSMQSNVIATGIKPQARLDHKMLGITKEKARTISKKMESGWKAWNRQADAAERQTFYGQQNTILTSMILNGEVLVMPLMLKEAHRDYNLALQLIEADRLDVPRGVDPKAPGGIRLGDRGQAVGYWIKNQHPGHTRIYGAKRDAGYTYYPAWNKHGRRNVFHLFEPKRPGQSKGEPWFAPVIGAFQDMGKFSEAEIISQRIAACIAMIITNPSAGLGTGAGVGVASQQDTTSDGDTIERMEPGMIETLSPGQEMKAFNPTRNAGAFEPFMEYMLREISTAVGMPYELVSKDFSKTNYSSARAALLEARRYFRTIQRRLNDTFNQYVWEMLVEEMYLRGELDGVTDFYTNFRLWTSAKWLADGWEWIDPIKSAKASEIKLNNGVSNLQQEFAEQGKDWEEETEQAAYEKDYRKSLGLSEEKIDSPVKPGNDKDSAPDGDKPDDDQDKPNTSDKEQE